eukprot:CAMPEP_0174992276 /NCGR_PEP_ID=MMETSP0004_2-20121128/22421_1 /TAXON_ID=420556 /ORGANISM="Ochromonas sp., Strain CCMP1393" /LENGTH=64 /DNA_ID=CAMNT_0016246245 /DNA_START=193 /DNA_END=387 /DNA_ORIENTATION=-
MHAYSRYVLQETMRDPCVDGEVTSNVIYLAHQFSQNTLGIQSPFEVVSMHQRIANTLGRKNATL